MGQRSPLIVTIAAAMPLLLAGPGLRAAEVTTADVSVRQSLTIDIGTSTHASDSISGAGAAAASVATGPTLPSFVLSQDLANSGRVTVEGVITYGTPTPVLFTRMTGYSGSVTATGAAALLAYKPDGPSQTPVDFGSAQQTVANNGTVELTASKILLQTPQLLGSKLKPGAAFALEATGARADFTVLGLRDIGAAGVVLKNQSLAPFSMQDLSQTATNTGRVSNRGATFATTSASVLPEFDFASDAGVNVSLAARGAAATFDFRIITQQPPLAPVSIGTITQSSTNSGAITNDVVISPFPLSLHGVAPRVQVSAGAANTLSISSIGIPRRPVASPAPTLAGVVQSAINSGSVDNRVTNQVDGSSNALFRTEPSPGSIVSMGATGASSLFNVLIVNNGATITPIEVLGGVTQAAQNSGAVRNEGFIESSTGPGSFGSTFSSAAIGAKVGIVLTSALADAQNLARFRGTVTQTASNSGAVSNVLDSSLQTVQGNLSGLANTVEFSSSGALATVAVTATSMVSGSFGGVFEQALSQAATNVATVDLWGALRTGNLPAEEGGIFEGNSVSVSALGAGTFIASTSIFADNIVSVGGLHGLGPITQTAANAGAVSTRRPPDLAASLLGNGTSLTVGTMESPAASVSLSASGALASLSAITAFPSFLTDSLLPPPVNGRGSLIDEQMTQSAINSGSITTSGSLQSGLLAGPATSVAVSAIGAGSFVHSLSAFGTDPLFVQFPDATNSIHSSGSDLSSQAALTFARGLSQSAVNSGPVLLGRAAGDAAPPEPVTLTAGALSGTGASAALLVTGAAATSSALAVVQPPSPQGTPARALIFGDSLRQFAANAGSVANGVSSNAPSFILLGGALSGTGASVSASTTGAVASLATSLIAVGGNIAPLTFTRAVTVTQVATNGGDVQTAATIRGTGAPVALSGVGTSAAISTAGAAASVSLSTVSTSVNADGGSESIAPAFVQMAVNGVGLDGATPAQALISTLGRIVVGDLSGRGASVTSTATGATASVAVTSIASTSLSSARPVGSIAQTAVNRAGGAITNASTINTASLGISASAAISSTGASASYGLRSIR